MVWGWEEPDISPAAAKLLGRSARCPQEERNSEASLEQPGESFEKEETNSEAKHSVSGQAVLLWRIAN